MFIKYVITGFMAFQLYCSDQTCLLLKLIMS